MISMHLNLGLKYTETQSTQMIPAGKKAMFLWEN